MPNDNKNNDDNRIIFDFDNHEIMEKDEIKINFDDEDEDVKIFDGAKKNEADKDAGNNVSQKPIFNVEEDSFEGDDDFDFDGFEETEDDGITIAIEESEKPTKPEKNDKTEEKAGTKETAPVLFSTDAAADDEFEEFTDGLEIDGDESDESEIVAPTVPTPEKEQEFDKKFFGSVYKANNKETAKIVAIIIAFCIAVVCLVFYATKFVKNSVIGDDTIYAGVCINGYDLGGMTKAEVAEYVEETYFEPIKNAEIVVQLETESGVKEYRYPLTDFVVCPDADEIAEEAYNVARTGTESERISLIKSLKTKSENLLIEYEIVTDGLSQVVEDAKEDGFEAVVDPTYNIMEDGIVFTSGKNGLAVDEAKFKSDLNQVIANFEKDIANIESGATISDEVIKIDYEETEFKKLDADEIAKEAYIAPETAKYVRNSDNEIVVSAGKAGRQANETNLKLVVDKINDGENVPYELVEYDELTDTVSVEQMQRNLFSDELAVITSQNTEDKYSEDKATTLLARATNIELACQTIGEISLLSDESVTISDILGAITEENGYVLAQENVFDGGKEVLGGGISQFVSALYEAAMKANLTVSQETHNEYMPNFDGLTLGFDAVYSENNCLSIKNTTSNPVKISCKYENDTITITIMGLNTQTMEIRLLSTKTKSVAVTGGTKYTYSISRASATEEKLGSVSYVKLDEVAPSEETESPEETTPVEETESPAEETSTGESESPSETTPSEETEGPAEETSPSQETEEPSGETDEPSETTSSGETEDPAEETFSQETESPSEETSSGESEIPA